MPTDPVRNFVKVRISTGYDSLATSIILQTGDGVKLPDPLTDGFYNLVWFNETDYPDPADDPLVEIVRVTAKSTDTLTIIRGQEGTIASNKNTIGATYLMILAPTKKSIDDLNILPSSVTPGSLLFTTTNDKITEDNSNLFWDNTNKKLGIGTNVPTVRLQIVSDQIGGGIALQGTGNNTPVVGFYNVTTFGGSLGLSLATGHILPTSSINDLVLQSQSNLLLGTNNLERMRLDTLGNITIGTTSKLTTVNRALTLSDTTSGNRVALELQGNISGIDYPFASIETYNSSTPAAAIRFDRYGADDASRIRFVTKATGIGMQNQMTIDPTGKVGIGTITPAYNLDVVGNSRFGVDMLLQMINPRLIFDPTGTFDTFDFVVDETVGAVNGLSIRDVTTGSVIATFRNNGNVGIGTTDPGSLLELYSGDLKLFRKGSTELPTFPIDDKATISYQYVTNYPTTGAYGRVLNISASNPSTAAPTVGTAIRFLTSPAGSNATTTKMIIDHQGYVGIGTITPGNKLEVVSGTWVSNGGGSERYRACMEITTGANNFADIFGYKDGTGAGPINLVLNRYGGNLGIGITTPDKQFQQYIPADGGNYFSSYHRGTGGTREWVLDAHGNWSYLGLATGGITRLLVNSSGNVGIATTSPGWLLTVNGAAAKPGGGSWTDSSDIRLKKNINPMQSPLSKLLQLKGIIFEWDEEERSKLLPGTQMGMIAQDVEKVFPQWVSTNDKGYKDLTFRGFEALAVEAIKELSDKIDKIIYDIENFKKFIKFK